MAALRTLLEQTRQLDRWEAVLAKIVLLTDKVGTGANYTGQASWSVRVPKADYYRIEIETDLPGRTTIESDLIPLQKLQAQGFKLYLAVKFPGLNVDDAQLVEVPPW